MQTFVVAVGSVRPLKLRAVADALELFGGSLDASARFDVVGVEAPSGVSHTPTSRAELLAGARGRANAVAALGRERGQSWKYFVGLEGGLDVVHESGRRMAFLESWAFVANAEGRESWGHAGGVMLPESLAAEVLDRGVELSAAIDAFADERRIRDAQGAWGVLTRDLITRQDVLRTAVINAFAPFFNAAAYSR
jgi:non-canonical (house-cleaning) NTP pyrophosphatase